MSQIGILHLIKCPSSWWSVSYLISRIVFFEFCTFSLFLKNDIRRFFLFTDQSIIMFMSRLYFCENVSQAFHSYHSHSTKKNCSSLTGPSRSSTRYALTRDVFSFQFLESSSSFCSTLVSHRWLPHSSFVFSVFGAIRLQIRDIIEVNCLLIQILQVNQQVFSPEQKYLNTWPSSNRFQWISNQRRIAPHHRTRWSQWKAMIHKL